MKMERRSAAAGSRKRTGSRKLPRPEAAAKGPPEGSSGLAARAAPPSPGAQRPAPAPRTRTLTVVAQDPGVRVRGRILTSEVEVPAERLAPGPHGHRVQVIDYDASTRTLYAPLALPDGEALVDPYRDASNDTILEDPGFHAQNVYALVMRTLSRFEFALGRRVPWSVRGHQIRIAPHAFADANAFYSERDGALLFGYFPGKSGTVFTCLSHDVVVHETTHALLDGLRTRYTDPSSPDQAAFHEGFADVVALLSVFSLPDVTERLLDLGRLAPQRAGARADLLDVEAASVEALRASALLGLAEQMGTEIREAHGSALRRSVDLAPEQADLAADEFREPHRRGEVFVAAVTRGFLQAWVTRLEALGRIQGRWLDRQRVAEEGAALADALLTMCIRALDYCPPVHLEFPDFLSALLTADREIRPQDARYRLRDHLRDAFGAYGIRPAARPDPGGGYWAPVQTPTSLDRIRFESLLRDPDEVFRFVWENRAALGLVEDAPTQVCSVRPCLRIAPEDGFPLRETVAEVVQVLRVPARDLGRLGIRKPPGMADGTEVTLAGGLTLVFDEYGRLKFSITNSLDNAEKQSRRLQDLWDFGHFAGGRAAGRDFSRMHRMRAAGHSRRIGEGW